MGFSRVYFRKALENASRASADVISEKEALIAENAEIKQELTQWSEKFAQLSNKHQQVVAENAETIRGLKVWFERQTGAILAV